MRKAYFTLTLFLLSLLKLNAARADVIFIDLNFNSYEAQAAKAAATQRGEKLVIIPLITEQDRKRIYDAKHTLEKTLREIEKLSLPIKDLSAREEQLELENNKKGLSVEHRTQVTAEMDRLSKQISEYLKSIEVQQTALQKLGEDQGRAYSAVLKKLIPSGYDFHHDLDSALAQVERENGKVSSLVMSSEHTSHYYGDAGSIEDQDLFDTLEKHKAATQSIGSFFGWGCYTAEVNNVLTLKAAMPELKFVAGFDGQGPKEGKSADSGDLFYLLTHEKEALEVGDQKQLKAFFDQIPDGKLTNIGVSICNLYQSTHDFVNLNSPNTICSSAMARGLTDSTEYVYNSYFGATRTYLDVPADTGHSNLRDYYNFLKRFAHCSSPHANDLPAPDQVISLIYFKNLMRNFGTYYKSDLDWLKALPKTFPLEISDLTDPKTTRAQVIKSIHSLSDYLSAYEKTNAGDSKTLIRLRALKLEMDIMLNQVSCVPDHWIGEVSADRLEIPETKCLAEAHPSSYWTQ